MVTRLVLAHGPLTGTHNLDAPAAYLLVSQAHGDQAAKARERGWQAAETDEPPRRAAGKRALVAEIATAPCPVSFGRSRPARTWQI
jgi:hypothetical protein